MFQFFRKKEVPQELPAQIKVLIVNAQVLVDETRKLTKEKGWEVDLTCKMQLRDDCARVEQLIKRLKTGNYKETEVKALEKAVICLQTTSQGILKKPF